MSPKVVAALAAILVLGIGIPVYGSYRQSKGYDQCTIETAKAKSESLEKLRAESGRAKADIMRLKDPDLDKRLEPWFRD